MEASTIVALSLTIFACNDGGQSHDNYCFDGSHPDRIELLLEVKRKDKLNHVEITKNDKTVFVIHEDGSIEHDPDFNQNQIALDFWKNMASNYPNVCIPELTTK